MFTKFRFPGVCVVIFLSFFFFGNKKQIFCKFIYLFIFSLMCFFFNPFARSFLLPLFSTILLPGWFRLSLNKTLWNKMWCDDDTQIDESFVDEVKTENTVSSMMGTVISSSSSCYNSSSTTVTTIEESVVTSSGLTSHEVFRRNHTHKWLTNP